MINKKKIYQSTLLAVATLSCVGFASAQSSVTMYGNIDLGVSQINNQRGASATRIDSGNRMADRLGFRGIEDLGGGYKAVFVLESGFNSDDGSMKKVGVLFNRMSFVGLSSPYGTVTAGHIPDFMYEYLRGQSSGNMGLAYFFHPGNLDNQASQFQLDNAVKYESPTINGFTLGAMNGFGEQAGDFNKARSYSLGLKYKKENLTAALASTVSHNRAFNLAGTLGVAQVLGQKLSANPVAPDAVYANFNTDLSTSLGANAAYTMGQFTPHAMVSRIKLETRAGTVTQNNVELGSDYTIGRHTIGLSVMRSTFEDVTWKQVNLIEAYQLSKRSTVYAALAYQRAQNGYAAISGLLPSNTRSQTAMRVGLNHMF